MGPAQMQCIIMIVNTVRVEVYFNGALIGNLYVELLNELKNSKWIEP